MPIFKKRKIRYNKKILDSHIKFRDKTYWTSSNGRKTKISDLDINHMRNIINKHERGESMNYTKEQQSFMIGVIKDELLYRQLSNK